MVLEDDKLWWFMSPQTILMAQWELGGMQEVLAVLRQMSQENEI
jgi:hypothetical protein